MLQVHHPLSSERLAIALELLDVGDPSPVVSAEGLGGDHAPVTRLRFDRPVGAEGGSSVVVKTRRVDGAGWGGTHHLRREIAALAVVPSAAGVTPRLLAADEAAGVIVLEDVGASRTLEAVLLDGDGDAATAAFVDFAMAVGTLHAATRDAEVPHRDRLGELGSDARRDRLGMWPGVTRWDGVVGATRDLGLPDAAVAVDDVDEVRRALEAPDRDGALIHLDLNPTNVLITEAGARLVDFEGATFGHAGLDASFLHFPFPNYSAHWAVLPPAVVEVADTAYRSASAGGTAERDTTASDRMLAIGAAGALTVRVQRLPVLAADDQTPHDSWRRRAQLVQQIEVFAQLTERADVLPALRTWFWDLRRAMCDRWPDAAAPPPPLFPAFEPRCS